jgi:CDP-diacylglycerol--serine O-phosphatidyltransferase
MGYKIRSYFPNLLTLISLSSGFVSILLSSQGQVSLAALFILVSVGLDFLDGYFARKLAVDSNFGIQLDSLADMVCFGVAPAVLVFSHLMIRNGNSLWFVPFLLVYICAGAFRLARYNLLPAKQSSNEGSVGLTITSSGIIISLAVLSDLSYVEYSYPLAVYLALVIILCCLMVSRMILPAPS